MPPSARLREGLALWGPVAAYLAGITILSHQPSLKIPGGAPDWVAHTLEYAGLGVLVARAMLRSRAARIAALAAAAAGCAAFGLLDEFHQSFVPGRDASLRDAMFDTAGASLALAAVWLARARRGSGRRQGGPPIEIVLYGRRECHLCDDAEKILGEAAAGPAVVLRKVDIDQDPELKRLYGEQVPVVTVNGRKLFKLRVDPAKLRRKIDSLQHTQERRTS